MRKFALGIRMQNYMLNKLTHTYQSFGLIQPFSLHSTEAGHI